MLFRCKTQVVINWNHPLMQEGNDNSLTIQALASICLKTKAKHEAVEPSRIIINHNKSNQMASDAKVKFSH